MRWRRTDPVQAISALLLTGPDAAHRLGTAMAAKSTLFHRLRVAHGDDWAAVLGAPLFGEAEIVLPRIDGATALYEAPRSWWMPVGLVLDLPERLHDLLLMGLAKARGFAPPAILVPSGEGEGDAVHVYPVGGALCFSDSELGEAA